MKTDRTLQRTFERESVELLETARRMLDWNIRTGELRWKVKPSMAVKVGDLAGCTTSAGYREIKLRGTSVLAHRLIWALAYGEWPDGFLDHKNMDRADCRISNLRGANRSQNGANRPGWGKKNGGRKGVVKKCMPSGNVIYQARIQVDGEEKHLGSFPTPEAAEAAHRRAAEELFGEFAFNRAREQAQEAAR